MQELTIEKQVVDILNKESLKRQLAVALPKHITPDRMVRIATTELRMNKSLLRCDPLSFVGAIIQSAQLGLEPGGSLGHAYLIPYGRQCNLVVGYKGLMDLARRSGQIISLSANPVYENDVFEYEFGINESLRHVPAKQDRGNIIAFYAYAKMMSGGFQFDVMSKEDVDKIRATSKSANAPSSPWKVYYEEMGRKTVVRKLFKYLPISIEMQRAVAIDEKGDVGIQNNAEEVVATYDLSESLTDEQQSEQDKAHEEWLKKQDVK